MWFRCGANFLGEPTLIVCTGLTFPHLLVDVGADQFGDSDYDILVSY